MGLSGAISQKSLQELHSQVQKLTTEKQDYERDWALKEGQFKAQVSKLREEKQKSEKQLIDTEFLVAEKEQEIQKLRNDFQF